MKKISSFFIVVFILLSICAFGKNDTNKTYKTAVPFGDIKPRNLMYVAETTDRLVYDAEEEVEVYYNNKVGANYTINLSTNKNQFYDIQTSFYSDTPTIKTIKLPACKIEKSGKFNLYIHQSPVNGLLYDISEETLSESSIPNNKAWLTDETDGIWKLMFESLPGTSEWILVRYMKHEVEPYIPDGYSRFWNIDGSIITTNLVNITDGMFINNSTIENIELGSNVTIIGNSAFYNCNNLRNVIIGKNVITIGGNAFSNCDKLLEVTILDGVKNIAGGAFGECVSLKEITIPVSVTTIYSRFVSDSNNLLKIIFDGRTQTEVRNMRYYSSWGIRNGCVIRCTGSNPPEEFQYP